MRVLIIFNHPAPYKVEAFNELSKYCDLTVLFERTKAKDRPDSFYDVNDYKFKTIFLKDGYIGREGTISNGPRNYIKRHHQEFDAIIMNGYSHFAEIKAIRYLHSHKIKFGLLINGGVVKKEGKLKKLYKTSLVNKADYYMSPSDEASKYLEYYGAKKDVIYKYIYSNLREKEIIKEPLRDKSELRKRFGLPLDKNIFINPSQFIERKNNLQLLSLFKGRKEYLVLVGSGPEKDQYLNFIKENNMDNVKVMDFMKKNELFDLYKACDVHITLSKQDIFGHTVLEAFANGLPVISSNNVVSSLEYIKNGYNGYIVDLNNEEEINKRIDEISDSLSVNALESARNNTFENSAKSIYQIIGEVYGK